MKRLTILTVVTACLVGASARAHDTWIIPDQFNPAPKSTVKLDMTSGMEFPKLDVAPKPDRVESAACRLAGKTFAITNKSAAPNSLQFKTQLVETGVATCWVKLPPKSIELKPAEVLEYLGEIEASAEVRRQWAEMEPKRWRELYTKHPKTFVRVGNPPTDRSWMEPIGMALEIVPEKDPTALREGDELPVQVLKNGVPYSEFSLNAVAGGEAKGQTRKTNSDGRVTFQIGRAGRWLLRGTDVRKSNLSEVDYESDFATLTLEVGQKKESSEAR